MFLTYPHTVRRIAARGTAHTLRRLVQIQPERGKAPYEDIERQAVRRMVRKAQKEQQTSQKKKSKERER